MEYIIKNMNDYNANEINFFYNKLHNYKKNKVIKYTNKDKKLSSIIGDILLSELLYTHNLQYDKIDFYINENGKPYIKNKDYYFNISHSFEYIITILSTKEIGIDIEKIRKTSWDTINLFATDKEKKYILSSEKDIEKRIFEIYTLKEAYIKMLGTYMNELLNVEFTIQDENVICSDKFVKAGFIKDIDGYIISYCEKIY